MEAIIYIPGLGTRVFDQSVESFAYRFKKALDINDPEVGRRYDLEIRKINYGKDNKQDSQVVSIFTIENGEKKVLYEIFELSYGKALTEKFEKHNIIVRTLLLFGSIIIKIPEVLLIFIRSIINIIISYFTKSANTISLSFRSVFQFSYAAVILLLISSFGIILLISLISYLPDFFQMNKTQYSGVILDTLNKIRETTYAKYIIGISTAVFLLLPAAKNFISIIATEYLCTMYYLNFGDRRQNIIGKLEELTEHVCETTRPDKLSFYCYSFGSIIAADALFPFDGKTSFRFANSVQVLVTIGSPIDFVKVYWPSYFASRKKTSIKLKHWYNVYSKSDILSSNFRYDDKEENAEYSIAPDGVLPTNIPYNILNSEVNYIVNTIFLLGLRAHQLYWDDEVYSSSCFTNLVGRMYEDGLLKGNDPKLP